MNFQPLALGLLQSFEAVSYAYFLYVAGYTFTFSLAGRTRKCIKFKAADKKNNIAVLVPAYKEDAVILETARHLREQTYPSGNYRPYIIADSLQPATLARLRELPIEVIEVGFEKSTKVKALNTALKQLPADTFEIALILDADNIMAPDFLEQINGGYEAGFKAIQGQRIAKNANTKLAILDGISEAINNHIYRQGSTALHMASSLIGSGMAFDFNLLKNTLADMSSVGGFDRELEVRLLQQGIVSTYTPYAQVKDEKVSKQEVFVNQRKRWIASQYIYLKRFFRPGCKALLRGEFAYFNSAVLRNIQLPRLLNIGLLGAFTAVFTLLHAYSLFGWAAWWLLATLMAAAILMAIPKNYFSKTTLQAIGELPKTFFNMAGLFFKLRGANNQFIHTQKGLVNSESK